MVKDKIIPLARIRTDCAAFWEKREIHKGVTKVQVVANPNGLPKEAVVIHFNETKQALTPVIAGDYLVKVFHQDNGISMSVFVIERTCVNSSNQNFQAEVVLVARKEVTQDHTEPNTWSTNLLDDASVLNSVIETCIEKVIYPDKIWSTITRVSHIAKKQQHDATQSN